MKKILIIEDEAIAAQHLGRLIKEAMPDATVIGVQQSIEESIEYFSHNPMPDLCFVDIHLADGLAFRIFDKVDITCPIIFTTAYDQYALDAFKVNSIDYLLKPIDSKSLLHALNKLDSLIFSRSKIESIATDMQHYRSHFLVPMRDKLIPVNVSQIACLYLEDKITRAIMYDGRKQIIDRPLETVMEQLDPRLFYRANRQYIVAHRAIKEITIWPISKLSLTLVVDTPTNIIVSKAKVPEFKQWYTT